MYLVLINLKNHYYLTSNNGSFNLDYNVIITSYLLELALYTSKKNVSLFLVPQIVIDCFKDELIM